MKVALLAPTPPPAGGIAGWTERMKKAELKNGWQVVIVDEKLIGKREVFGKKSAGNVFIEAKRCIAIWKNLARTLKDSDVKIVQACIPATTTSMLREIICAGISKWKKRKFIVHFRCTLPNMVNGKISTWIFKKLVSLSDYIFVLNNASADFINDIDLKAEYAVIPNFIEEAWIKEKAEIREKVGNILYVGGVVPEKGCDLIFEVAKGYPNKKFLLVGKPGMDSYAIPENVIITGEKTKDEVEKYMQDADVFLFMSRYFAEGFSNALVEAMANSLPCIVTDWAANRDMIEDKGGIVLEEYSSEKLKDAIDFMEDRKTRIEFGEWNRNKVKENYTEKIVTNLYVDVYERLI